MRSSKEIKEFITELGRKDIRIRSVLLQGSRANPLVIPDRFQDFDIVFIVDQMDSFTADHGWTSLFGDRMIWQLPDEMQTVQDTGVQSPGFHYLMLFTDGVRIDLTLFPAEKMKSHFTRDSLTVVWLDKDSLFTAIDLPGDKDYLIRKPAEKEFAECCNEFWWVSTYITKGLARKQISYTKAMMEGPVRKMFMRMIEWYIGTETKFSVSFGMSGKMMKTHLDQKEYKKILKTYPDYKIKNIRKSLFLMTDLFSKYAEQVSEILHYDYNQDEYMIVKEYLHWQSSERK